MTGVLPLPWMGSQPALAVYFIPGCYSCSKARLHIHVGPEKLLAFEVSKASFLYNHPNIARRKFLAN